MTSSLIRTYDVIIIIYEVESLYCFFVFGWIKLKFAVRGNFTLLISNLNSKVQYQFNATFLLLDHDFSSAFPHELVTMATMNDLS